MSWADAFKFDLRRNGGRVAVRLDIDIPPIFVIEIDPSSIADGLQIGFNVEGEALSAGETALFDPLEATVDLTEGVDFDNTTAAGFIATTIADAFNSATNGAPALGSMRVADGRLYFVGRQRTSTIRLMDTSVDPAVVFSSAPSGFNVLPVPTGDVVATTQRIELSSVDDVDGPFGGTRDLLDFRFGAEQGEAITREYSHEDSEATIAVNPRTSFLFRWFPTFRLPCSVHVGARSEASGWRWAPIFSGSIARWTMAELGSTYKIVIQPTWGRLSEIETRGEWIHMHPLEVARTLIERAGATIGSSVTEEADTTRSHFSVTRANDRWARASGGTRDPWFNLERFNEIQRETFGDEEGTDEAAEVFLREEANVVNAREYLDNLDTSPPTVEGAISETEPVSDLLNQIALMMNGGFYEEPNGTISFRVYDRDGDPDTTTIRTWNDITSIDDLYASRVVVNYAQSVNARAFRQTFTLESPINLRGGEVIVDMPWVNGVSELRSPLGATIATTGRYREDVTDNFPSSISVGLTSGPTGIISSPSVGINASGPLDGIADVVFSCTVQAVSASGDDRITVLAAITDSANPVLGLIEQSAVRFGWVGRLGFRFQIRFPRVNFVPTYTPQFLLREVGGNASILWNEVRFFTPDAADAGGYLFWDDRDFIVANPARGFSGARLRLNDTGITTSQPDSATLDEAEGRRAYVQITSVESFAEGTTTVPPTDFREASEIWGGASNAASNTEIVVVNDWAISSGGTVGTIESRALADDRSFLRNEHPYFADSPTVKSARNLAVWDADFDPEVSQQLLRRRTPMRLRASIDESYNGDGAIGGRTAFGVGRFEGIPLITTSTGQTNAGFVPFAHQIAFDVPQASSSLMGVDRAGGIPEGFVNLPGGAPVPDLYAIAADVTIPVYFAKATRERFESGAPQIEVRVGLEHGDVPMWSRVQLHAPDFHVTGTNGFSDGSIDPDLPSIVWEVTGRRIDVLGDTPGIVWTLTALKITDALVPFDQIIPPVEVTPTLPPVFPVPSGRIQASGGLSSLSGSADAELIVSIVQVETVVTNSNAGETAISLPDLAQPSASNLYLVVALSSFSGGRITDVQYGNTSGTEAATITDSNAYVSVWVWDATDLSAAVNDSFAFTNNGTTMNDWAVVGMFLSNVDSTAGTQQGSTSNGSDPQSRAAALIRSGSALFQFSAHADGTVTPTVLEGVAQSWSPLTITGSGGLWGVQQIDDGTLSSLQTSLEWGDLQDRATVTFVLRSA